MSIKNVDAIKAKAKGQIIDLLNKMGCYRYSSSGIDKWLDNWEAGCEKQITEIAERHPFYDGDCKIVFPAEYPREIDKYQISQFANWLYAFPNRNAKEVFVNGFSVNDTGKVIALNDYINYIANVGNEIFRTMPESFVDEYNRFVNLLVNPDYQDWIVNANAARKEFRRFSKYVILADKAIEASEYRELSNIPTKLAEFLVGTPYGSQQFLCEDGASQLNEMFPECRFAKGQKLSKAVRKIASKYNLLSDPEWEREFASFADAVNPLTVVKWTVISWHPMDYLTFCFGDSWSSCCTIDKDNVRGIKLRKSRSSITNYIDNEDYAFRGEHSAAALSYMFDNTSFIYYTVSEKYKGKLYEEQPKSTRIVFSLSDDMTTLLETRLYPQCNDDNPNDTPYRIPREIVQKVICDSIDVPNLWTVKKGKRVCSRYAISDGVHYADYLDERNKQCNISYRGEEPSTIYIGRNAICPECGRTHNHISSLNCPDCDPYY